MACTEKKAAEEKRTIVWIDQSGFYLLPMAVRTWAPRGQTPVLRVPLTRDHLAAISAITPQGRLVMQMQDHAYCGEDVVRRLSALAPQTPWEASRESLMGRRFIAARPSNPRLSRGAAKRLYVVQLPGYAPELNPDEGIWNYLKRVEREECVLSRSYASGDRNTQGERSAAPYARDHS